MTMSGGGVIRLFIGTYEKRKRWLELTELTGSDLTANPQDPAI